MADHADIAADIQAEAINIALENHRAKQPLISRHFCSDCGVIIPESRRSALRGVTRCVDCQDLSERRK